MNFDTIGEMALGSRLRALSEAVTEDSEKLYQLYNIALKPKWFPVFYSLSNNEDGQSITSIAQSIGHTHPSVIKIIKEMSKADLISEQQGKEDRRINNIKLTKKGMQLSLDIQDQYIDVENAMKTTLAQTDHNLWLALKEFEDLLAEKSIYQRVIIEKKQREAAEISIINCLPIHFLAFKYLNEEWIRKYFTIEDTDKKSLDNPKTYILDHGGKILIAMGHGEILGVCALIKMNDPKYDYELAKMAVSPKAQGKGIGYLLGKAIISEAKSMGASNLYLESNTILKPAISLYNKLGFTEILGHESPYARCNIQMELKL